MIISYDVLEAMYNHGYRAYDAITVIGMSSETRNRAIRRMVGLGLIQSKPFTNPDTGKKYNLYKITDEGRKAFRRERILRKK